MLSSKKIDKDFIKKNKELEKFNNLPMFVKEIVRSIK